MAEKPEALAYPETKFKYRHYGKIVQDLIKKAIDHEEGKDKEQFVGVLLNLMKRTYLMWNNNSVTDDQIISDLKELSNGKLEVPEGFEFDNTAEIVNRNFQKPRRSNRPKNGRQNHRRGKKN